MSSLPKIDYPIYTIEIPSTKQKARFRPFLVKEEKLLLMAKESENSSDILTAVKQIVNNCAIDPNFDVDKLAIFDLELVFIKLRSFSVDNVIKVAYKDLEDEKIYNFEIKLDDVEILFPENTEKNIKITEKSGIVMKYPSSTLYDDKDFLNLQKDYLFELIIRCIDSIYYEDQVYDVKNYKKEEISEFLENLNVKTFDEIQKFLLNAPKIYYKIEYKNDLQNDRTIEYSSLNDFFMWR
jgi:phage regulator Rha-like protein